MGRQPGILTHQAIRAACGFAATDPRDMETSHGTIRPAVLKNVRSAGYDLRIGDEYYLGGMGQSGVLDTCQLDVGQAITLEPNQLIVIRALEQLHFEADVVGHLSLKMDLLLRGVIMASQSQVDAGYHGWIFALLYNLSDARITIRQGQSFLRLELVALDAASDEPYTGAYGGSTLRQSLKSPVRSSLENMRERVDVALRRVDSFQSTIRIVGVSVLATVVVAAGGAFLTLNGSINDVGSRTAKLEGALNPPPTAQRALRATVDDLCKEVKRLQRLQKAKARKAIC